MTTDPTVFAAQGAINRLIDFVDATRTNADGSRRYQSKQDLRAELERAEEDVATLERAQVGRMASSWGNLAQEARQLINAQRSIPGKRARAAGTTRAGLTQSYAGDDPARCNAKCSNRGGRPCRALKLPGKKRCKWHGGLSTGPRTPEGKAKCRERLAALRHKVDAFCASANP